MIVVDYKTGKTAVSTKDAAESLQLGFYALAAMSDDAVTELGDVVGAELWYPMTKAKSVTTRKFRMEGLGEVETRLATIATGIMGEDWSPTPGPQCERCGLRPLCPVWADGGPEFQ